MPQNNESVPWLSRGTLNWLGLVLLGLGLVFVDVFPGHAQRARGTVTIGPQVGQPGGVSGKLYRSPQTAYEALVTTDGNESVSLYLHRLHERALPDSLLYLYLGPGLLTGVRQLGESPTPTAGISSQVGLNFYAERFEVFLHVTPGLRFLPDPRGTLGASVGLRYTFRWR
jgi:hypothetical protein